MLGAGKVKPFLESGCIDALTALWKRAILADVAALKFSVIEPHGSLPAVLERFAPDCQVEEMTWDGGWERLSKIAAYQFGPDVSQIGTTWLDSLVATGAVRPFAAEEVEALGGASLFLPASWQMVRLPSEHSEVWAIPWLADARVIFYWRDMLEEAGVDAETAFQTPERVEETMERLQASGIDAPWGIWGDRKNVMLQNVASWIWSAGGDIIGADGKQIFFDQPEAMQGFLAYFHLHRYMPPDLDHIPEGSQILNLFTTRRLAVVMGACSWLGGIQSACGEKPDMAAKIGLALPPGPAFVGGSNLIVWQHTRHVQEAVDLVRFLISKQTQLDFCRAGSFLPARLDVLSEPPYATDVHYQVIVEALKTGRAFPMIPKWGDVEEKLGRGLVWLWDTLLANPGMDSAALVRPYIEATARRLAITLGIKESSKARAV
jgi:multiple sugar transport system substrate-binding protein